MSKSPDAPFAYVAPASNAGWFAFRTFVRDTLLVAQMEVMSAIRSRKLIALGLVAVLAHVAATLTFASIVHDLENSAADMMLVPRTERPGVLTDAMMSTSLGHDLVSGLVGDSDLATQLVTTAPVALFFGWFALLLVPMFAVLSASGSIASTIGSGSCRHELLRTTRSAWASGKFVGQVGLMVIAVVISALTTWITAAFAFAQFPYWRTLVDLSWVATNAVIYSLPYLGIALGVSQWFRGPWSATSVALVLIGLQSLLRLWLEFQLDLPSLLEEGILLLTPGTYALDLWQPQLFDRLPSIVMLVALGGAAFLVGYARLRKRDL